MNLLNQFKEYLFSQDNKPSAVTVKNYLSDVNHFIRWFENTLGSFVPKEVTKQTIKSYKAECVSVFSPSSMDRHFSSLRKFFVFLKLEGLIVRSPFEQAILDAQKLETDPWHIKDFRNNLYVYNASHLTIKNYLIDIKQFLNWTKETTASANVLGEINPKLVEDYKQKFLNQGNFSPATINRKLSSLRKYLAWAGAEGLIESLEYKVKNTELPKEAQVYTPAATSELLATTPQPSRASYSSFPPLRLAQKVSKVFLMALDAALINPVASLAEKVQYGLWKANGQQVFTRIQDQKAKLQGFASGFQFPIIKNLPKESYAPLEISTKYFPWHKKALFNLKYRRPQWYKTYHSYPITHYFHVAVLIIFLAAISFGFYNVLFQKGNQSPTLAAALPVAPPRILSFQGRLTDNLDNPISTASALRFAIYNDKTATDSGDLSVMLWQEVDTVIPDQDGIFNVMLGSNNPIPSTLFTSSANLGLWLGVTVQQTAELTPRQQLATVAFATNAETLQGLVPITAAGADVKNVVLALDASGNLTIGAGAVTANPVFQANGTFKISGQPLLLTTNVGSNGNVQVAPDGMGYIDLQKPLINSTNNNNLVGALGSVEVDDMFSILATSSGASALTLNQNGGGDLIAASASGTTRFRVANTGQITASYYNAAGCTLKADTSGNITCGIDLTGGGGGFWQEQTGALSPINLGDDFLLGSSATQTAKFAFTGLMGNQSQASLSGNLIVMPTLSGYGGNVGIGTINPTAVLTVAGSGGSSDFRVSRTSDATKYLSVAAPIGNVQTAILGVEGTSVLGLQANGGIGIGSVYSQASGETYAYPANGMVVQGSVGIGTHSLLATLDVRGNQVQTPVASFSGNLSVASLVANNDGSGDLFTASASGTTRFVIQNSGNVGIGTSNPGAQLELSKSTSGAIGPELRLNNPSDTGSDKFIISAYDGASASPFRGALQWTINPTDGKGILDILSGKTSSAGTLPSIATFLPSGFVGIGTTTPTTTLDVNGNASLSGTLSFRTGTGNIQTTAFSALTIGGTTTGNITLSPFNSALGANVTPGITNQVDLGTSTLQWRNIYGQNIYSNGVLLTNGGLWQRNNGALMPLNITDDFLLGANVTGTASAQFSVTGIAKNQAIASLSGNLVIMPNNGWGGQVGIGTTTPTEGLSIYQQNSNNLLGLYDATSINQDFLVTGNGATTLKPTGFAAVFNCTASANCTASGADGGTFADNTTEANTARGTTFSTWATGTAANTSAYVGLDHPFATIYIDFSNVDVGSTVLNAQYWNGTAWTNLSSLVDNTAIFHNDGTITFNIPSDWTTKSINSSSNLYYVRLYGTTNATTAPTVYSISPTSGSRFSVFAQKGDANPALTLTDQGNVGIGTPSLNTINGTGANTNKLFITGASGDTGINIAGITTGTQISLGSASNITTGTGISVAGTNASITTAFTGNYLTIAPNKTLAAAATQITDSGSFLNVARNNTVNNSGDTYAITGDLVKLSSNCTATSGVCADTSHILSLTQSLSSASGSVLFINNGGSGIAFNAVSGGNTTSVASISGQTSFAALVANNNGVGDLFTASASGWTRFRVTNAGTLLPGLNLAQDIGSPSLQWNNVYGGNFYANGTLLSQLWQRNQGALSPLNITDDLLIGTTATPSASNSLYFQVYGAGPNEGSATMSGNLTLGTNGGGSIQTTMNQLLTVGGNTTGDIKFMPGNSSTSLYLASSGNVGIGTTAPAHKLELASSNTGSGGIGFGTDLQLYRNGTSTMIIDSNGTTNATSLNIKSGSTFGSQLNIYRGGSTYPGITLDTSGGNRIISLAADSTSPDVYIYRSSNTGKLTIASDTNGTPTFVGFGTGTQNPLATIDIRGASGTLSVASISGQTSFAALVANNNGVGDLFTASASGTSRFTITNAGGIALGGNLGIGTNCLLGGITATWGSCGSGTNFWQRNLGALSPLNITDDLLLGGISTTSAKFAFTGLSGNQSQASMSGNLVVMPTLSGWGGNVAIGTTSATARLDVSGGGINIDGGYQLNVYSPDKTKNISFGWDGSNVDLTSTGQNLLLISGGNRIDLAQSGSSQYVTLDSGSSLVWNYEDGVTNLKRYANGVIGTYGSFIAQTGQIGIGTSSPLAQTGLDIEKNVVNAALLVNQLGAGNIFSASLSGVTKFIIDNSGNVGIGTSAPLATLDARGFMTQTPTASFSGKLSVASLVVNNDGAGDLFTASSSGWTKFKITSNGSLLPGLDNSANIGASPSARYKNLYLGGGSLHIQCLTTDTGCPASQNLDYSLGINSAGTFGIGANLNSNLNAPFNITQGGSIGIGTVTPVATLDLRGNSGTTPIASFSGSTSFAGLVVDNAGSGDLIVASSSAISPNPSRTQFQVTNTGDVYARRFFDLDASSYFLDPSNLSGTSLAVAGKVGIGNNSPATALDVRNSLGTATIASISGNLIVMNNGGWGGNVGIGTTAPGKKLEIDTTSQTIDGILMAANDGHGLWFGPSMANGSYNNIVSAGDAAIIYSNGTGGALDIAPWASATSGIHMNSSGQVGIGTANTGGSLLSVGGTGSSTYAIYGYSGGGGGVYGYGGSYGLYGVSGAWGAYVTGGQYGIGANGPIDFIGSHGEYTNGAAWTNGSSRVLKENFINLDNQTILGKILQLPITEWNYISTPGSDFIGPMAEDFYALFGLGGNNTSIDTVSPAAIALVGIKALNENLTTQQIQIASLSASLGSIDSRITIDNSGNVGIGTTAPQGLLDISRSNPGGMGGELVLRNSAGSSFYEQEAITFMSGTAARARLASTLTGGNGGDFEFLTGFSTAALTQKMVINADGTVGIGTLPGEPTFGLTVRPAANSVLNFRPSSDIALPTGVYFQSVNDTNTQTNLLAFNGNPILMSTYVGAGNVGIGNNNPQTLLDVGGVIRTTTGGTYGGALCGQSGSECFDFNTNGWVYTTDTSHGVYGSTGIAMAKLSVAGPSYFYGAITNQSGDTSQMLFGPNTLSKYLYVGSAGSSGSKVDANTAQVMVSSGNLHIDSVSGGTNLAVYIQYYSGNPTIINGQNLTNAGVGIGHAPAAGRALDALGIIRQTQCISAVLFANSSGDLICNPSSRAFKNDITNLSASLSDMLQLNPVSYVYKPEMDMGNLTHFGFIAQDVAAIFPELATYDAQGNPIGLDTNAILSLTVNGVKQLNNNLVQQQVQIASLSANLGIVAMTNTGNLNLVDNNATSDASFTIPHYFTLNDALGNPISGVGAFADVAIANLRAGLVNAQQVTTNALNVATENITINGQNIKDYIAGIVQGIINSTNNNVVSPIATADEIHTGFISPIGNTANIGLKLDDNKLSVLNTNSASGSAVAVIDNQGNASFSGQLTSNSFNTNDATISGTLHVGKIFADQIVGATNSATYVTNITNIYNSTPSAATNNASGSSASNFGLIANAASIGTPSAFGNPFANNNYIDISSYSGQLSYVDNLSASTGSFSQGLMVFGPTSLSDTSVVGQLSINGNLILANDSINVLGSDLSLQPLRQGGLSIMGGLVYIDTEGNLKVGGNAEFAKDVKVDGTLSANIISPLAGNNLTLDSGNSNLEVKGASNSSILSVNPLGDLIASGAATISKLNLSLIQPALAVSPTEVVASGSAGTTSITANKTQVTIDNPLVTAKSLIYITPTSNTNNQVLYLLRQTPGTSFTVGLQNPSATSIPFNWIIVN